MPTWMTGTRASAVMTSFRDWWRVCCVAPAGSGSVSRPRRRQPVWQYRGSSGKGEPRIRATGNLAACKIEEDGARVCCGAFCVGVRGGAAVGGGDVPVHRYRGFDPSVGGRRRCDAGGAGPHDQVLRSAIEAHGGCLFKHTGDGVCAAFASPRAAVDAAVTAQRALGLPVRMGMATGEAELRDGTTSVRC